MKCIEKKLQSREPLLSVDDRSLLHCADRILHLLEHNGTQEMRIVLRKWIPSSRSLSGPDRSRAAPWFLRSHVGRWRDNKAAAGA
jgi:hypothetical protein